MKRKNIATNQWEFGDYIIIRFKSLKGIWIYEVRGKAALNCFKILSHHDSIKEAETFIMEQTLIDLDDAIDELSS